MWALLNQELGETLPGGLPLRKYRRAETPQEGQGGTPGPGDMAGPSKASLLQSVLRATQRAQHGPGSGEGLDFAPQEPGG